MQQQQQPRGYGGYNQNMMDGSMQQSSSSSGMPYSSQAATANPTRLAGQQNQQNYQHQQVQRQGQQDDMASSFGGSTYAGNSSSKYGGNSSTVNGGSSPTSTGPTPGGSSAQQPSKPVTGSPEEIENSRRIARTHFEEFKAFLDAEGQRGELALL